MKTRKEDFKTVKQEITKKILVMHKSGFKMVFNSLDLANLWINNHIKYNTKF